MSGRDWVSWPLAGLMVLAALVHTSRLVAAQQRGATQDGATQDYDVR